MLNKDQILKENENSIFLEQCNGLTDKQKMPYAPREVKFDYIHKAGREILLVASMFVILVIAAIYTFTTAPAVVNYFDDGVGLTIADSTIMMEAVLLIIGALLVIMTNKKVQNYLRLGRYGFHSAARVSYKTIESNKTEGCLPTFRYVVHYSYIDLDGKSYYNTMDISKDEWYDLWEGQTISILCDPNDPTHTVPVSEIPVKFKKPERPPILWPKYITN